MKLPLAQTFIGANECPSDAEVSPEALQSQLQELETRISGVGPNMPTEERLKLQLEAGYLLLDLERRPDAWDRGWEVFQASLPQGLWLQAVEACDLMYQSEAPEALRALAHGIWLSVTFPVDPELTVAMLQHLIDETPSNSDGAAVAAATACYVVDLRAQGVPRDSLRFFSAQLLGDVARRHSQVEEKDIFDFWVERMELNDPSMFLPRLGKVLDVITGSDWWYDRDELRRLIPDH